MLRDALLVVIVVLLIVLGLVGLKTEKDAAKQRDMVAAELQAANAQLDAIRVLLSPLGVSHGQGNP